jgi:hypothetical protein
VAAAVAAIVYNRGRMRTVADDENIYTRRSVTRHVLGKFSFLVEFFAAMIQLYDILKPVSNCLFLIIQLPVVVARVNQELDGVVDVQVDWEGGDHFRVGEHIVECRVTRLASVIPEFDIEQAFEDEKGNIVGRQCFFVPFEILDTNECTLPKGHVMRHQCHESTICINTIGSYECVCPSLVEGDEKFGTTADDSYWESLQSSSDDRSAWEVSFSVASQTTCPSSVTTFGCCPTLAHANGGPSCREGFRCPVNPCARATLNECASSAICQTKESPLTIPNYECQCPKNLMGNGRRCRPGVDADPQPKLKFDGVTPTEETIRNDYYCDCTTPVVDPCAGFPPCEGK